MRQRPSNCKLTEDDMRILEACGDEYYYHRAESAKLRPEVMGPKYGLNPETIRRIYKRQHSKRPIEPLLLIAKIN